MVRMRAYVSEVADYFLTYFNSYMVRLREKETMADEIAKVIFQFLYGSIERIFWKIKPRYWNKFQFLYGSIERQMLNYQQLGNAIFQFLYGSIESVFLIMFFNFLVVFQFLYGSIESRKYT